MIYISQFISLLCLIFWVKGDESYSVSAKNGTPCLTDTNCHELSYFTEHPSLYFSDNTVFYFLEGRHVLNDTIEINGVSNLTLKGLGTMEQGFHYTVLQSTVEISCEGAVSAGLVFINVSDVSISDLLITRCSGPPLRQSSKEFSDHLSAVRTVVLEAENQSSSVLILQSLRFLISGVTIVNTTGYALTTINILNSTIINSSFASNNLIYPCSPPNNSTPNVQCKSGNVFIAYTYHWPDVCENYNISLEIKNSNFSFGNSQLDYQKVSSYGGGLTVLLDQGRGYCTNISIVGVSAYRNTARSGGNLNFFASQHTTCFQVACSGVTSQYGNMDFRGVNANRTGGGLQISFGITSSLAQFNCCNATTAPEKQTLFSIQNSSLSHNIAEFGGGANVWINELSEEVYILFHSCTFLHNEGQRGVALYISQENRRSLGHFIISAVNVTNSLYKGNGTAMQDLRSSVALFHARNVDLYNIHVSSNSPCYGMYLYYTIITFYGVDNTFINNTSLENGGAIFLSTLSSIKLTKNSFVTFTNNHANGMGGALFVDSSRLYVDFCFLDVHDYSRSQEMKFINNSAGIRGDAIFLARCSRLQRDQKSIGNDFFRVVNVDGQPNTTRDPVSSFPYQIFHCEDNSVRTGVENIMSFPGESIVLKIVTRGIFGVDVPGLIQVKVQKNSTVKVSVKDTGSIAHINGSMCTSIVYINRVQAEKTRTFISYYILQKQFTREGLQINNKIEFNIGNLKCPAGFMLYEEVCQCNHLLAKIVSDITCNITTRQITRVGNKWIGFNNDENSIYVQTNCPYDYCVDGSVSFNVSTPDNQCRMNRSGIMCGQCSKGLSLMLGSNQCGVCTNSSLYLLVVFGVAGIVLVLFLVVLNLTVSVGTINGLIFYTNVIKINENAFLSNSSPPVLSQFISWFNLDLGINTCFISSIDTVTKLALQFVFPAYIWILIGIVIIICKYSQRLSRAFGHNAVPVFATLILLSYTKVIRTLVPILKFERVTVIFDNNQLLYHPYWSANGNISPSSLPYIWLVVSGVFIVFLFAVPYTVLLLFQPLMLSKFKNAYIQAFFLKFKPLFDAYYGPYQVRFQVWTGLLLCVRTILVLTASFTNSAYYLIVTNVLGIGLLGIMTFSGGVYKQKFVNGLECWSILNITVLSALVKILPHVAIIDLSVMFFTFAVVSIYHLCTSKIIIFYCAGIHYKWQVLTCLNLFKTQRKASIQQQQNDLLPLCGDTRRSEIRESLLFSGKLE